MLNKLVSILFLGVISFLGVAQTPFIVYNDGFKDIMLTSSLTATVEGSYVAQTKNGVDGTIDNQGILQVTENWSNNNATANAFTSITGTVNLIGTTEQFIGGTKTTSFNNLVVNNLAAIGGVTVSRSFDVSGALTLTDGIVSSTSSALILMNAGSSSNAGSIASFVDGPMQKTGATAFVFPLGNGAIWARLGIGAPSSSTTFQAQYFASSHSNTTSFSAAAPVLNNVSSLEYWNLSKTIGSGNASITLYWENATFSQITNCADLKLATYINGKWAAVSSSTTGLCAPGGIGNISTSGQASSFISFTFGSLLASPVNPLPIELLTFDAKLINNEVKLDWTTSTEINNDYFTIERTQDGLNYEFIAEVTGAGNSNELLNYTTYDYSPLEGISYYRLKQTDFDGKFNFSNLALIENNHASENSILFNVFPNPTASSANAQLQIKGTDKNAKVLVVVRNVLGQLMYSKIVITDDSGSVILAVDPTHRLSSGTYLITGSTNNNLFSKKLIIR